jgi:uncharacterized protein YceK
MRKTVTITLILLIALAMSGCTMMKSLDTAGSTAKVSPTTAAKAIPGSSFAGNWQTDWGTMAISVNGNVMNGTYAHEDGRINGTVNGTVFNGTWSESPSYKPPNDAGAMSIRLSGDGSSFSGEWWYGNATGNPAGNWVGTRIV